MSEDSKSFNSSLIDTATYDSDAKTLTVTTQKGREYTFDGILLDIWSSFQSSPSPGRFFNEFLKGKF